MLLVGPGDVFGGVETHIRALTEWGREWGIDYQVATLSDAWRPFEVKTHRLRKRYRGDMGVVRQMADILRHEGIDIVHTHMPGPNLYGRLAARMVRGVGVVSTLHYSDSMGLLPLERRRWCICDGCVFGIDIVMSHLSHRTITPNDAMRRGLAKAGVLGRRVVNIPHGVDTVLYAEDTEGRKRVRREWDVKDNEVLVGTCGRMAPVKNYGLFLRALGAAMRTEGTLRGVLVGDGLMRHELEAEAERLGIDDRVRFAGFRKDMCAVLSALDVFVVSSDSEMGPYVALEAMAVGCPLVSTAVGIVREIVDERENGIIYGIGDEGALESALRGLACDANLRKSLGASARRKVVRECSREVMMAKLRATYEDVCRERGRTLDGGKQGLKFVGSGV